LGEVEAFKEAMKEKRIGKKHENTKESKESKDEIVVQRLSSQLSGKAKKYLCVGPQEFVHVGKEELTFENIQKACLKHFTSKIARGMYCDILAGEQDLSCSTLKQIPDMKLITTIISVSTRTKWENSVKARNTWWFPVFLLNANVTQGHTRFQVLKRKRLQRWLLKVCRRYISRKRR
jgi:hypothetical protein